MKGAFKLLPALFLLLTLSCTEVSTTTNVSGPSAQEVLTYHGPKARIAVASFKCKAAKCGGEIGSGIADMLATALFRTGRFIVLERGEGFQAVQKELELGQSSYVNPRKAAKKGYIETADVLVVGAITAFEPNYTGGAGAIGGLIHGKLGGILGSIKNAYIAADIRLVDVRTGRIISATTVEGKATSWGGMGGLGGSISRHVALGAGLSLYRNTPMEKAIRVMINNAVNAIAQMIPENYYRYGGTSSYSPPSGGVSYVSFPQVKTMETIKTSNVRRGPGINNPVLATIPPGTTVKAMGKQGSWYQVTLPDGRIGWIHESLLR